jgi:hypothetical protein
VLNGLAIVCLVTGFVLVLMYWSQLPDRIPTHFNAVGEVDDWGPKGMLWLLPAINIVLVPGILVLQRFPWVANIPITINASNADYQYGLIIRLLSILGLSVAVIFLLILIETLAVAFGGRGPLGIWMLPVLIAPIILSLFWYLLAMVKQPGEPVRSNASDADKLSSDP